ncbi:MAG TPA: MBL fold metallo-hydrolase [Terracidiphilus sp.]|nr:MBL fold metallo-hydrolase [Terracidiphilus sp.]
MPDLGYAFDRNDPFDRHAPVQLVIPKLMESERFMESIRKFQTSSGTLAVWFLGQNGFILKYGDGPLIGIDLYLSNSCASMFAHLPFRLDRQLPVFVEPEDLDIDVFITTHSHQDHADPETIGRMKKGSAIFVGPFDSCNLYRECGVPEISLRLIHPGETIELGPSLTVQATFAFPTDSTDLNHTGTLLRFPNGTTFFDTGDTAYAERLSELLPVDVDICAICINGGFHNLSAMEAAHMLAAIRPRVVIPCHYDMMINNTGSPAMLRVAMDILGSKARFQMMEYYEPWLYERG